MEPKDLTQTKINLIFTGRRDNSESWQVTVMSGTLISFKLSDHSLQSQQVTYQQMHFVLGEPHSESHTAMIPHRREEGCTLVWLLGLSSWKVALIASGKAQAPYRDWA